MKKLSILLLVSTVVFFDTTLYSCQSSIKQQACFSGTLALASAGAHKMGNLVTQAREIIVAPGSLLDRGGNIFLQTTGALLLLEDGYLRLSQSNALTEKYSRINPLVINGSIAAATVYTAARLTGQSLDREFLKNFLMGSALLLGTGRLYKTVSEEVKNIHTRIFKKSRSIKSDSVEAVGVQGEETTVEKLKNS